MSAKTKKNEDHLYSESFRMLPVLLLITMGFLLVLGSRVREGVLVAETDLIPWACWLGASVCVALFMRLQKAVVPGSFVSAVFLLAGIGMLIRARMSGYAESDEVSLLQLIVLPLGLLCLWLIWWWTRKDRVRFLRPMGPLCLLLSLALVAAIAALGTRFRGAAFAPGNLTPTELLKIMVPIGLAWFFASAPKAWVERSVWRMPLWRVMALGAFWGLLGGLLAWQRDLGLLVLLSCTLAVLLIAYTRKISWGILMLLGATGAGVAIWQFAEHGSRRLQAWLDPFADPTGAGWQMLQGISGLYAGGLLGTGLGEGRPDRIPIADSDFVYAVLGEETGFVGCLLVVGLFAFLLRWGMIIARRQADDFNYLLALGITASLAIQVFVNISGVVGLLPITGITLPLISQGGSSFLVTCAQFGILLGLSETTQPGKKKKPAKKKKKS